MASIVFLGHGGFDQNSGSYPGEVLVPPGTTLRYFSDAGQPLVLPAVSGESDYNTVVNVWEHFHEDESPIPERWVTYNYGLWPEDTEAERTLALSLDWGATVETLPAGSSPWFLCQGDETTCPTPALNVQQREYEQTGEGDPVEDDRWNHHCDGILGTHAGNDLVWIACTSFMRATPELPPTMTAGYSGPGASDVSDWVPDDEAWQVILDKNRDNIKAVDDDADIAVVAGGVLVLIGGGHSRRAGDYVARQADVEEGNINVEKGGTFSKGKLTVTGISAKQDAVRQTIEQFSDKKVVFE